MRRQKSVEPELYSYSYQTDLEKRSYFKYKEIHLNISSGNSFQLNKCFGKLSHNLLPKQSVNSLPSDIS